MNYIDTLTVLISLVIDAEDCKVKAKTLTTKAQAKAKTWTNKAQAKDFYGGLKATQGQGLALRFTSLLISYIKSR